MTGRTPVPDKIRKTRISYAVRKVRDNYRAQGMKRKDLWVPQDMTREEGAVLQEWIPEILEDIRAQMNSEDSE